VRYATATAFRTALEARLLAHSPATRLSLDRLRKQVVFERILARLLVVAPDRWILKGGFAPDVRLGTHARPTKDVDLSRHDDVEHATADMVAAQSTDVGDYFQFVVERTEALDDLLEGAAVRYRVNASLAGRRFEQVVVDIGFGDPFLQEPDMLSGTGLLEFADVQSPRVPAIPLTQHVAEKVHAYARVYGQMGRPSTRVKDLVDLVLIGTDESFQAADLERALEATYNAPRSLSSSAVNSVVTCRP
jgi:hypothetical protein